MQPIANDTLLLYFLAHKRIISSAPINREQPPTKTESSLLFFFPASLSFSNPTYILTSELTMCITLTPLSTFFFLFLLFLLLLLLLPLLFALFFTLADHLHDRTQKPSTNTPSPGLQDRDQPNRLHPDALRLQQHFLRRREHLVPEPAVRQRQPRARCLMNARPRPRIERAARYELRPRRRQQDE